MAVAFRAIQPHAGLAFGTAEPAHCHPAACPLGARFPSTKVAVGTFPQAALAATPCACFAPPVLTQRAEVPPVGRSCTLAANVAREDRSPLAESGQVQSCLVRTPHKLPVATGGT